MPDAQFDLVESYDTAPQSDWFHACREAGKPYVVVRTSEKSADVMWDYVTLPPSCDIILIEKEGVLREKAIAIFRKYASNESNIRVKATIVFFDNLSIPKAKLAANDLYALIESLVENPEQFTDGSLGKEASQPEFMALEPGEAKALQPAIGQPSHYISGFELIATG